MRLSYSFLAAGLAVAGLLAAGPVALAQEAPVPTPAPTPNATPAAAEPPRVLFKLGTGVVNGSGYGGYGGLTLPVILGAEWQFAPGWSAAANGSVSWNVGPRRYYGGSSSDRWRPLLAQGNLDAAVRHYYHQEKRQQKGRRTGPYQGPYVALQFNNYFQPNFPNGYNNSRRLGYDYSSLNLLWGTQRRVGGHGLLDTYIGAGVSNNKTYYYDGNGTSGRRQANLHFELGLKMSLVNK
ncbi:hypothetical protein CDA63_02990 [Hymenobacter amundsenii]|uniref:Outer membrane protein beta-barrel domain-containing protein n=1 Tax=Hymenobacter amundsenii TaxID=2006685 RepID=A0A246FPR3_9BACT|nr:hypothetical protein [Hymenobacter amundsenii]OWP64741.1 hypothetical protein CDA63_02990 [Hymenobacter amundsenii]